MPVPDSKPEPTDTPSAVLHDRRPRPQGVLPRHLQTWLMVGLAITMLLIIVITGHPATPRRTDTPAAQPSTALNPERLRQYQEQLAQQETRLRQELSETQATAAATAAALVVAAPGEQANSKAARGLGGVRFQSTVSTSLRVAFTVSRTKSPHKNVRWGIKTDPHDEIIPSELVSAAAQKQLDARNDVMAAFHPLLPASGYAAPFHKCKHRRLHTPDCFSRVPSAMYPSRSVCPKCLQNCGRTERNRANASGRSGSAKTLRIKRLSPEVARHHQVRKTR